MKLSIVTNAFNQGRFLRRCMASVLEHKDVDLEYIIVDPGSTDQTAEILTDYEEMGDSRLKILRGRDDGPADGLNKGFASASGDWFIYLNADDFFLPHALNRGVAAISDHPGADCVYGDGYITDIYGNPKRRVLSTPFTAHRFVWGRALVLQQSTFYKAESFRKIGGFNVENKTSWDAEILISMSLAGMNLVHVSEFWSAFVIHSDSITGSQRHAEESKRNHDRMFQMVTGHKKTKHDFRRIKKLQMCDRILNPARTIRTIQDRLELVPLPNIFKGLPPLDLSQSE